MLNGMKGKVNTWLSEMDFNAENRSFEWAGETKCGVVLFLLRHSLYHMGELSSCLMKAGMERQKTIWSKHCERQNNCRCYLDPIRPENREFHDRFKTQ